MPAKAEISMGPVDKIEWKSGSATLRVAVIPGLE
jgi:hypothetical protein